MNKASILSLLIFALTAPALTAKAQNTRGNYWEHNVYVDFGGPNGFTSGDDSYSLHVGYGVSYYLSKQWSAAAGIAYRTKFEPGDSDDGEGNYDCSFVDIPLLMQYHLGLFGHSGLVFELGPVVSILASNSQYYIDSDPASPLSGKDIYRYFDLGLQPGVYYQAGKHWRIGIKGHVGLLNIERQYPTSHGSYHYTDLTGSIGYCF